MVITKYQAQDVLKALQGKRSANVWLDGKWIYFALWMSPSDRRLQANVNPYEYDTLCYWIGLELCKM